MIRVYVICEGSTEETFVRDVLAPEFSYQQVFLIARGIKTSPDQKGGALNYDRVKRFIINCLKENDDVIITTFFDLYGLDKRFPSYAEIQNITDVYQKTEVLENALKRDVIDFNSTFTNRFLPYIQPYEFEGLLFSEIDKLVEIHPEWSKALAELQQTREAYETPEHINDSYETKPSERIKKALLKSQINFADKKSYRKSFHGPLAIQSIGIDKLCAECKHFAGWYQQLIQLGMDK